MSSPDSASTLVRQNASMSRIVALSSASTLPNASGVLCRVSRRRLRYVAFFITAHLLQFLLLDHQLELGLIDPEKRRRDPLPIFQPGVATWLRSVRLTGCSRA